MKSCKDIEPLLTAYIDAELGSDDVKMVEAHLSQCVECAEKLEKERGIKRMVHEHYRMEVTPVHLRARIRRTIAEGRAAIPGFFELIAQAFTLHKLKGAFAFVALFLLVTFPYFKGIYSTPDFSQTMAQTEMNKKSPVELVGEVLCVDCEILDQAHIPHHHEPGHRMGIKTANGQIWNFIPDEQGKKLLHNNSLMNQKIKIEGFAYPNGNYVDIKSFHKI
ncbi:MAG: hypothetical protein D6814_16350 [Calditrichaeota bacterium]|nr:MAG: hypothetical protein D6814_16350 [Calditrichota bacterium]